MVKKRYRRVSMSKIALTSIVAALSQAHNTLTPTISLSLPENREWTIEFVRWQDVTCIV
jgi:hypothetical protein